MKEPTREYLMVLDLMLEFNNLNISRESQGFLVGLYQLLDPYLPFMEQQTEKQKKWLYDLHKTYIRESKW
jgi:hypothetical protein